MKNKLIEPIEEKEVDSALDWFYDKIKSHFEHDGDLFETLNFTYAIAKQKERDAND
jgi:hemerythrin